MSQTDQNPSEGTGPKHPICPTCDVPMWLVQHRPAGSVDEPPRQVFECKVCGSKLVLPISRFPKKLTDQLVQSLLASDPQETAKMIAPSRGMADRLCTSFLTDPVYSSLSLPRTYPVLGSTKCTIWQTVQLTVS